ncbi:hypothetical protein [Erythrobacter sp. EC-HK427]|uniref:hypothetical protein n=1 Tax=Erythrobacter sp. EC-HK427 TaxID=2038396 RepID=UPI00125F14D2|nr:hypothetical protein [Erythrobacter sp. EC-HK427]
MRFFFAFAAGAVFCFSSASSAQVVPPAPFNNSANELAVELEREFHDFLGSCNLPNPLELRRMQRTSDGGIKRDGNARATVSSIAPPVIRELRLTDPSPRLVQEPWDATIGQLFAFVGSEAHFSARRADRLEPTLALRQDSLDIAFVDSYSSRDYRTTCASFVSAYADANGGFSLPFATIRANIEASTDNADVSSLHVVNGVFQSPVWSMWTRQGAAPGETERNRFFAGMLFWNWRLGQGASQPGPANSQILSRFQGTVVYRRSQSSANLQAQGSFDAGLSIPLITRGRTSASAGASFSEQLKVRDFSIYIDDRQGAVSYAAIPPAANLASEIRDLADFNKPDYQDEGRLSGPNGRVTIAGNGFPTQLCGRGAWTITEGVSLTEESAVLSLADVALGRDEQGNVTCEFSLAYRAPNDSSRRFSYLPTLRSRTAIDNVHLVLRLPAIVFDRVAEAETPPSETEQPSTPPTEQPPVEETDSPETEGSDESEEVEAGN